MRESGFTLIELLVGISILALETALIVGSFIIVNDQWRASSIKEQAINEVRLALDLWTTELSFGSAFPTTCDNGCDLTSQPFAFVTQVRPDMPRKVVEYKRDATTGQILRAELVPSGPCSVRPFVAECYVPLTSARNSIGSLRFFVANYAQDRHPLITAAVSGVVMPGKKYAEAFAVSTSATPRSGVVVGALPPTEVAPPVVTIDNPTTNPTYDSSSGSIQIGGTATDNVAVTQMTWANETTAFSGSVTMTFPGTSNTPWLTSNIDLAPGVANRIVVRALDSQGNVGTDIIDVTAPAGLQAPVITVAAACYSDPNDPWVAVSWGAVTGADDYYIYRCEGAGCSNFTEIGVTSNLLFWDHGNYDTLYRYSVVAHSQATSTFSANSNTAEDTTPLQSDPTCGTGSYSTPYGYPTPGVYATPAPYGYPTPVVYATPAPYGYPTPYVTPAPYGYPTPYVTPYGTPPYGYPTPYATPYTSPAYGYPTPYATPYASPAYGYPTPYATPPASGGFNLGITGSLITAQVDGNPNTTATSTGSTITVSPQGGFSGSVNLSVTAVNPSFSYQDLWQPDATISSGEYGSGSIFRVRVPGNTPPISGSGYEIVVTGTSGGQSDSVSIFLRVQSSVGFEL